jgi:hypothetical protein
MTDKRSEMKAIDVQYHSGIFALLKRYADYHINMPARQQQILRTGNSLTFTS